jgi:hypothetical protein
VNYNIVQKSKEMENRYVSVLIKQKEWGQIIQTHSFWNLVLDVV